MKTSLLLVSLFASTSSLAANFGAPAPAPATTAAPATATAAAVLPALGPQVAGAFRIFKADGSTLVKQGTMSAPGSALAVLDVSEKDALVAANGKCAFNVKYDEVAAAAASGTTNRIYSNDALVAQNTKIDLAAGVVKTIWTQPYLAAGMNNVRLVVNADGASPSTAWIRVNVAGTCGAKPVAAPAPAPAPVAAPAPKPAPAPAPAPVVRLIQPGSGEWNNLNNAWGYSNYATTQLKGKGYARYDELVRLNAAITAVINAKSVDVAGYNSLMTSWNTFVTEAAFQKAMAAVVATKTPGQI